MILDWWKLNVISNGKAVFMPDVFGWAGALVVQMLIIACLFIACLTNGKTEKTSRTLRCFEYLCGMHE